ncbi:MAG: hypothetical protein VX237_01935, partial [Chloroflexota bacterium]|nr:hypothetical protein [Chloroflexota bacterium]
MSSLRRGHANLLCISVSQVNKALDAYGSKFENIVMMGDINTTETDEKLIEFLEDRELSNLVHF